MSDETSVNAAAMATGLEDLKAAHRKLTTTLDQLTAELSQSLANWDGDAKQTYYTCQKNWNEDCDHMASVIDKMNTVLGQITEGYSTTEAKIVGSFGG